MPHSDSSPLWLPAAPPPSSAGVLFLVCDPQAGWVRRHPSVPAALARCAAWLDRHQAWERVWVPWFWNPASSPFRRHLPRWNGFRTPDDWRLEAPWDTRAARMFPRATYGLPDALWDALDAVGPTALVLAGVETDATVCKTAMDAFDHGWPVWVVADWVASAYGEAGQAAGLAVLRKVLGRERVVAEAAWENAWYGGGLPA